MTDLIVRVRPRARPMAVPVDGSREPEVVRFGPWVMYRKQEAFEICSALALAESVLRQLGREEEASWMAAVFDVAEARLPSTGRIGQLPGSNSSERELTQ